MAPSDDDLYPKPTVVEVDPEALKKEAARMYDWGKRLNDACVYILNMKFPVGDFPAADRLRNRLTLCVGQLATNTWDISKAMQEAIYENLYNSADGYINDEDDNKNEATRYNSLVRDVSKYGPGAETAAPVTPGLPPPAAPQPVPKPPDLKSTPADQK